MSTPTLKERLKEAHDQDEIILAISLAERLIADGADAGWIFEVYASNLIGIGRYDDAVTALDRAEQLVSDRRIPWVIHRRAHLERQRGNLQSALDLWKQAHSENPNEATFPIYAATMAHRLGRLTEAEELARIGTECSEGNPDEAYYNLGGYLAAQERYEEAMNCYEKAIDLDPEYEIAIKRRNELREAFPEKWGEQGGAGQPATRFESE